MSQKDAEIPVVTGIPEIDERLARGEEIKDIPQMVADALSKYSKDDLEEMLLNGQIPTYDISEPKSEPSLEDFQKFVSGEITLAQLEGVTPQQAYAIASLGYEQFQQGKFETACALYEGLVALNPNDPYFHRVLGAIYMQMGRDEEALNEIQESLKKEPEELFSLVARAELFLKIGRFEQALNDLKQVMKLDPKAEDVNTKRAKGLARAASEMMQEALRRKK